jgi:hypothetical protein
LRYGSPTNQEGGTCRISTGGRGLLRGDVYKLRATIKANAHPSVTFRPVSTCITAIATIAMKQNPKRRIVYLAVLNARVCDRLANFAICVLIRHYLNLNWRREIVVLRAVFFQFLECPRKARGLCRASCARDEASVASAQPDINTDALWLRWRLRYWQPDWPAP